MSVFDEILAKLESIKVEGKGAQQTLERLKNTAATLGAADLNFQNNPGLNRGDTRSVNRVSNAFPGTIEDMVKFRTQLTPYQGVPQQLKSGLGSDILEKQKILDLARTINELTPLFKQLQSAVKSAGLNDVQLKAAYNELERYGSYKTDTNTISMGRNFSQGKDTFAHESWHYMDDEFMSNGKSKNMSEYADVSEIIRKYKDPIYANTINEETRAGSSQTDAILRANYLSDPAEVFARAGTQVSTGSKLELEKYATPEEVQKVKSFFTNVRKEFAEVFKIIDNLNAGFNTNANTINSSNQVSKLYQLASREAGEYAQLPDPRSISQISEDDLAREQRMFLEREAAFTSQESKDKIRKSSSRYPKTNKYLNSLIQDDPDSFTIDGNTPAYSDKELAKYRRSLMPGMKGVTSFMQSSVDASPNNQFQYTGNLDKRSSLQADAYKELLKQEGYKLENYKEDPEKGTWTADISKIQKAIQLKLKGIEAELGEQQETETKITDAEKERLRGVTGINEGGSGGGGNEKPPTTFAPPPEDDGKRRIQDVDQAEIDFLAGKPTDLSAINAMSRKSLLATKGVKDSLDVEGIDKIDKLLQEADTAAKEFKTAVSGIATEVQKVGDGWKEVSRTITSTTGEVAKSSAFIRNKERGLTTGEVFSQEGYKEERFNPTLEKAYPRLQGVIKSDQYAKLNTELNSLQGRFEALGVSVNKTSYSAQVLDQNWTKVNKEMVLSDGQIQNTIAYYDKLGNAYTQAEYKQKRYTDSLKEVNEQRNKYLKESPQAKGMLKLMGSRGFNMDDIQSMTFEEPSGMTRVDLQKWDEASQQMRKMKIGFDQFGGVINMTNRRFLDFTDSIARNTVEVFRWSIGVGLVYGAMYRLQNLMKIAIDNESKLADIAVVLGQSQRDLNEIFDEAAKVAIATGESINAVLESYQMAYSAAGGVTDLFERTKVAQQLLTDATVLNKLSNLSAAESIDVLSGSLRQIAPAGTDAADALMGGVELLDKWVALSNKSGVGLDALAMGFSVTAESALNAGMSVEELNAVIATLSEKIGGLGGKETGNAVRALIGGVYQEQAASALAEYGIAVKNSEGDMRDFLDISQDIYDLYKNNIISEDQLNKLGLTLGGGVRRGQQYVAFLTDMGRVQENVNAQSNSTGASQEALARKMDTTQTALTNLSNAFQSLAQTLGSKGGILDGFQTGVKLVTQLANAIDKLSEHLGKMVVPAALLTIMGAYQLLGGEVARNKMVARLGTAIFPDFSKTALAKTILPGASGLLSKKLPYLFAPQETTRQTQPTTSTNVDAESASIMMAGQGTPKGKSRASIFAGKTGSFLKDNGLGFAIGGMQAMSTYGETKDFTKAGTVMGGAVIGTLIAGGNPIGAVIGGAIAEAFVSSMEIPQGQKLTESLFPEAPPTELSDFSKQFIEGTALGTPKKSLEDLVLEAYKNQSKLQSTGSVGSKLMEGSQYAAESTRSNYAIRAWIENTLKGKEGVTAESILLEDLRKQAENGDRNAQKIVDAIDKLRKEAPVNIPEEDYAITQLQTQYGKEGNTVRDAIDKQVAGIREEVIGMQQQRDIKPKEARDWTMSLPSVASNASKIWALFNSEVAKTNTELDKIKPSLQEVVDIIAYASAEDTAYISVLTTQLNDLEKEYERNKNNLVEQNRIRKEMIEIEATLANTLNYTSEIIKDQQVERAKSNFIPTIDVSETYEKSDKKAAQADVDLITKEAEKIYRMRVEAQFEEGAITQEDKDMLLADTSEFFFFLGSIAGMYFKEGLYEEGDIQEAMKNLTEKGTIKQPGGVGYDFMDYTQAQIEQAANSQEYTNIARSIEKAGGTVNEEAKVILPSDTMNPLYMKKDWTIVQYLLGRILDVSEKQLEGIYNLPGDSSFYVPFDAYKMGYANQGTGGSGGGSYTPSEETVKTETLAAKGNYYDATKAMLDAVVYPWEDVPKLMYKEPGKILPEREGRSLLEDRSLVPPPETQEQKTYNAIKDGSKQGIIEGMTAMMDSMGFITSGQINERTEAFTKPTEIAPIKKPGEGTLDEAKSDMLNTFIDTVLGIMSLLKGITTPNTKSPQGGLQDINDKPVSETVASTEVKINPQPIRINFNATTVLQVDGRVLASAMMPYMYQAMVRNEAVGGGATTRSFV